MRARPERNPRHSGGVFEQGDHDELLEELHRVREESEGGLDERG